MNHRKPGPLKAISGTDRADRREPEAPQFDVVSEFPEPPQHLNTDGAAMWKRLGPTLVAAGQLQDADLFPLEQLCYAWQQHRLKAKLGAEISASENNALTSMFGIFGIGPAQRRRLAANTLAAPPAAPANRFAAHGRRPT